MKRCEISFQAQKNTCKFAISVLKEKDLESITKELHSDETTLGDGRLLFDAISKRIPSISSWMAVDDKTVETLILSRLSRRCNFVESMSWPVYARVLVRNFSFINSWMTWIFQRTSIHPSHCVLSQLKTTVFADHTSTQLQSVSSVTVETVQ